MSFLSPLFLVGALAAAIPIVLHLLRREPEPRVAFAAVRLLRQAPVEHTARRRLREWLLLALRVAALVLLAVAFARPFLGAGAAAGPSRATVVALDTSLSVSAPAFAARTRELAIGAIDAAPAGDLVGLVTFDHEAAIVEPPTADRARVRAAVAGVQAGDGGTRYRAAIGASVRALAGRAGAIVVVTDLQAGGWGAGEAVDVPEGVQVEVRDAGAPPADLAVVGIEHQSGRLTATVRDIGGGARTAVVRLALDDANAGSTTIRIPAGGEAQAVFDVPAGASTAAVRVDDPAGIQGDNVRFTVLDAADWLRVAVVSANGAPGRDALYAQQALAAAPAGLVSPFDVVGIAADALDAGDTSPLDAVDAVLLVSTRGLEPRGRERLSSFVAGGGGVFAAAGPEVDGEVLAGILAGAGRLVVSEVKDAAGPRRALAPTDARHPIFEPFGADPAALGAATFNRVVGLQADACPTVARFTTGESAIVDCADGRGRAIVFASDVDGDWNDFPKRAAFVPFLQASIRYLTAGRQPAASVTIAARPAGAPARPGIVTVEAGRAGARRVAVNVDPGELDAARLSAREFLAPVTASAAALPALETTAAREQEERQRLWQYGLGLALALLVVEGAVAARTA